MSYDHHILAAQILSRLNTDLGATQAELCAVAHVDRHTLARSFKPLGGFRRVRGSLQVGLAQKLLASGPGMNISEIASHCGFESASAFARFFRGRTGRSPRGWRAAARSRATLPAGAPVIGVDPSTAAPRRRQF